MIESYALLVLRSLSRVTVNERVCKTKVYPSAFKRNAVFTPPLFFHTEQNNISMTTHQYVILDNKQLYLNEKRCDVLNSTY